MAVHTLLSKEEICIFLKKYSIGFLKSYNGISEGIENTNYLIETSKKKFIFTIFEKRVSTKDLPFFLDLMTFSKEKEINCPLPILDNKNNRLNNIKNKKCAIFSFIEGSYLKKWDKNDCFAIGKILGEFHLQNKHFKLKKKNNFSIPKWNNLFEKVKGRINEFIPNAESIIFKELEILNFEWPKNLPSGIIHADLFPDNVLFKKKKIAGILDYYFSCNDYFIYDLCITINAWCFNANETINKSFYKNLLKGYESKRKLTVKEKESFNICLRGAAMRFLLTRLYDYAFTDRSFLFDKDPKKYFRILNFHINNNLRKKN